MRLDHIAYRTRDRIAAAKFFIDTLGYKLSEDIPEGFDIHFEDNSVANCLVLVPPEHTHHRISEVVTNDSHIRGEEYHAPPEIFVSDGTEDSIVAKWVEDNGPGIHHIAYEVESVSETMKVWRDEQGIKFLSEEPLQCPGLIQVFTEPHPVTGIIYELIERETQGFCQENVQDLMESTNE